MDMKLTPTPKKSLVPNPEKQLLACDQVITFAKNGKIQKTE